ncbi:MAG: hypothetical protein DLM53_08445 [Candidatus Eremiobacter antarcticus]|nr:hypothetical protein [Candidatus Eremiobacteraeota bacterium]MBC5809143.1 hypothetical protein [Candidatus Eremiobacteraeota bacterium]PZR61604.1 MAG: hypothetical protein DLM53_08445 [Candidatus Eremiobacter sp. RRmetagenome_bin22]PZR68255.1 MAG: hypothetical protein DLM63_04360 [Solirubrobacterales bacterium]
MKPKAHPTARRQRGIALVAVLLSVVLLMTLLAVMVNVGTVRLRRSTEELRSLQALAAADAGTGWVRGLLLKHKGDVVASLADLARSHSTLGMPIDSNASGSVLVSLQMPGSSAGADHVDVELQHNPTIAETPLQVVATASIAVNGVVVATRTVTTLLRTFRVSPYSETVGAIDNGGPESVDSPGDPAGQIGAANATDLRIRAFVEQGAGGNKSADDFERAEWSDGNAGSAGFLP